MKILSGLNDTTLRKRKVNKSEIRIPKSETNPNFKIQITETGCLDIGSLGIRACFEFRASDFEFKKNL